MAKLTLSIAEQIDKLSGLQRQAKNGLESDDLIKQLGGLTVYACLTDFYTIQASRLLEQILLKNELHQGGKPSFEPHDDSFFYDKRIDTRRIVKEITRFLPFGYPDKEPDKLLRQINQVAAEYMKRTKVFLNYRNEVVHRLCHPKITSAEIPLLIRKTEQSFLDMMEKHKEFFELLAPYRFGEKELDLFYGSGR